MDQHQPTPETRTSRPRPGIAVPRIRTLRGTDHAAVLEEAWEARASGEIPLIGDERWSPRYWGQVLRRVEAAQRAGCVPSAAHWATLTSGSTGAPRVLLRTQESWETAFPALTALLGLGTGHGHRLLMPVHPVSSMAPFSLVLSQWAGFGLRVPAGPRITAADLSGCDLLHGTPWHLRDVLDLLDDENPPEDQHQNAAEEKKTTALRTALIGGDALPEALRARARRHGLRVLSYYGATELSMIAMDDGTGLRPLDGVEVTVNDPDATGLGPIMVRTDQAVLQTLDGEPAASADENGWRPTGDLGTLDQDGVLHVHGRSDGSFQSAGATVVPGAVEKILEGCPGVRAALATAREDTENEHPGLGALVTAWCAVGEDFTGRDAAILRDHARRTLPPASVPRLWRWVPELPRTGTGKIHRLDQARLNELPHRTLRSEPREGNA